MRKRTFLLSILLPVAIWGGIKGYFFFTDGFSLSNIKYDLSVDLRRSVNHPYDNSNAVKTILSQEFHYMTKGRQSYVFESEDGKYVIKFFKYQRFKPLWHQGLLSWIPHMNALNHSRNLVCQDKLERLFDGCKVAYEELADLTGVVYLKLDDSPAPVSTLQIQDKVGFTHEIALNEMQFIIQHKTQSFTDAFKSLVAQNKTDEAENLVLSMIALLTEEYNRGYMDLDPLIVRNTGVLEGKALHLDIGQITKANLPNEEVFQKDDFDKKVQSYIDWVASKDAAMAARISARL